MKAPKDFPNKLYIVKFLDGDETAFMTNENLDDIDVHEYNLVATYELANIARPAVTLVDVAIPPTKKKGK